MRLTSLTAGPMTVEVEAVFAADITVKYVADIEHGENRTGRASTQRSGPATRRVQLGTDNLSGPFDVLMSAFLRCLIRPC